MKKNKIIISALVILMIILAISIGLNIKSVSERDWLRRNMINHAYSELTTISFNLNGLILNIESGIILPIIFGCISIYYLLKLIILYNPHPTMKDPIYMTFFGALSVIGFVEFLVAKYCLKNRNNNRM